MTLQEIKKELQSAYRSKERIKGMEQNIRELDNYLPKFNNSVGGSNSIVSTVELLAIKRSEVLKKLRLEQEKELNNILKVTEIVNEVDSIAREVLSLRYIYCKSWQQIQKELYLSERACFYNHKKGLQELKQKEKEIIRIINKYNKKNKMCS